MGTPGLLLFTYAAWPVATRGKRQSPPGPGVPRVGRTHRPQTWLSLLPKVWELLGARGLAVPRQGASPRKAEHVCQACGQFGSRLAAGPISSCSIPSLPCSGAKRFFCARALDLMVPCRTPASRSSLQGHLHNWRHLLGHKNPPTQLRKQLKASRGVARTLRPCPPSLVQLSKCFMVLIPVALSTGVVLITYTFQWANADHVPLL